MKKHILLSLFATAVLVEPALKDRHDARAQDDWGVRRDPFDKGLIARHKRALAKRPSDKGSLSKLMGMYRRYRSVSVLIREYEAAQQKQPSFANLMVLGYLHQKEKHRDKAQAYFEKAVVLKPQDTALRLVLGQLSRDRGEIENARKHYAIALQNAKKKPQKMSTLRALADLSIAADDIAKAKEYFKELIKLDPKNIQTQLELGEALAQFKKFDDAIQIFKAAETRLRSDPMMRIDVITRIGGALEKKGEDKAAIAEYERGIKLVSHGYYLAKELHLRIISIYRRRQELATLLVKLERDWKPKSRGHFEWDTLGRLYEETGAPEKAVRAYRLATKKAPYELDTQRRLIVLLENSGQDAQALKQYEAVIRVAPGEPRFQLELAKRYWKRGDSKKALAMAKKIDSHFSSDAGVVSSLADLYNAWERPKEALAAYQKLVRIEPGDLTHIENLGEQYYQRGDKKKAKQVWQKLMRIKNADSYGLLARVYSEHDLLPEGLTMYNKALRLAPKKKELFKGRASVHERLRKWNDAIADWEMVLKLSPDKASYEAERREARRRVVNILQRARGNMLSTKMAQWNTGFAATPPDIAAGYYLVAAYDRLSKPKEMTQTLQRLRTLRPSDIVVMQQLVKALRMTGQPDAAVTLLLKLVQINPGSQRDYYNQIAEIKTDLQQDGEAIEYVRRALEKSPNDPVAYQRLAERYQAMQKHGDAVKAYEKVIELSPRSYKVYFILARLYINRGKRERAAALYRAVLEKASDEEVLRKAGQEAVELEWLIGSLPKLERIVAPLVVSNAHKPIYRRILISLLDRYVPQLVAAEHSSDPKARAQATQELKRLGSHGLRPLLEALADETDPHQQETAVAVLGYLGNVSAAAPLVRLAMTERKRDRGLRSGVFSPIANWDLRVKALIAAGRLGDPRTIPDLVALSKHREQAIREAAVFALGKTNSPKALGALIVATDDYREDVQTLACLGMANINDKRVAPLAAKIVSDESKADIPRASCAWLLGTIGKTSSQSVLIESLSQGNDHTQRVSAWALGQLGTRKALPALMAAYFSKRGLVRAATATAISHVLQPSSRGPLPPITQYPMERFRFNAAQTVETLVPKAHLSFQPQLLIGLEDSIASGLQESLLRHRDLVLQVLSDLDARDDGLALGALTKNWQTLSASDQAKLRTTLTSVGTRLLPQLEVLTQHRDPEVRRKTIRVLAKLGGLSTKAVLLSSFSDSNSQVRQSAMQSAALFIRLHKNSDSDKELVEAVAKRLSSSDWQERVAAAKALGKWPGANKDSALIHALQNDRIGFVRTAAAKSLGQTKPSTPKRIQALIKASDFREEGLSPVRLAAVKALLKLGGEAANQHLHKLETSDPSAEVRRLAQQRQ